MSGMTIMRETQTSDWHSGSEDDGQGL